MTRPSIESLFPGLAASSWDISSAPTVGYNCIAWAAEDNTRWWEPTPKDWPLNFPYPCYWPDGITHSMVPDALIELFASFGYEQCNESDLEIGFQKVAIYSKDGEWTHAARQLPNGRWTSKLGRHHDIEHACPRSIEGHVYGKVLALMKRQIKD